MELPQNTSEVLATATDSWKRAFIIAFLAFFGFCGFIFYKITNNPESVKSLYCEREKKPEFVESKFEPALKNLVVTSEAVSAAIFAESPAGTRKLLMHFNGKNGVLKQYQQTEYSLFRADSNMLAVGKAKAGGVQCKELTPESSYGDYLKDQEGVKVICAHRLPNDKTQYIGFILVYFKEFPADWAKIESLPKGNERDVLETKFSEPFDRAAGEVVKY